MTNAVYAGPVQRPAERAAGVARRVQRHARSTLANGNMTPPATSRAGSTGSCNIIPPAGQNLARREWPADHRGAARNADPAQLPDWGGQNYTSAKIFSKGPGWTYGFYEVRAKLPCAPRHLAGDLDASGRHEEMAGRRRDRHHGAGRRRAEPDLRVAPHEAVNHTIKTQRSAQKLVPTSCTAFHVYQLDWRPDSITIGVDGRGILRVLNDAAGRKGCLAVRHAVQDDPQPRDRRRLGGAKGIDDAAMPQRMEVDYVRVWQAPR